MRDIMVHLLMMNCDEEISKNCVHSKEGEDEGIKDDWHEEMISFTFVALLWHVQMVG